VLASAAKAVSLAITVLAATAGCASLPPRVPDAWGAEVLTVPDGFSGRTLAVKGLLQVDGRTATLFEPSLGLPALEVTFAEGYESHSDRPAVALLERLQRQSAPSFQHSVVHLRSRFVCVLLEGRVEKHAMQTSDWLPQLLNAGSAADTGRLRYTMVVSRLLNAEAFRW